MKSVPNPEMNCIYHDITLIADSARCFIEGYDKFLDGIFIFSR